MRCLVIYNPAAGKKGAYRGVREQIRCYCQKEGIDLEEAVTQFPGHAEKIAEAAARTGEPVKIYGVGGDGTLCDRGRGGRPESRPSRNFPGGIR